MAFEISHQLYSRNEPSRPTVCQAVGSAKKFDGKALMRFVGFLEAVPGVCEYENMCGNRRYLQKHRFSQGIATIYISWDIQCLIDQIYRSIHEVL
jgi:hypothetical protein